MCDKWDNNSAENFIKWLNRISIKVVKHQIPWIFYGKSFILILNTNINVPIQLTSFSVYSNHISIYSKYLLYYNWAIHDSLCSVMNVNHLYGIIEYLLWMWNFVIRRMYLEYIDTFKAFRKNFRDTQIFMKMCQVEKFFFFLFK